jgi:hypothetical protein
MGTNLAIDHRRAAVQASERDASGAELLDKSSESIDPQASADRRMDAKNALSLERSTRVLASRPRLDMFTADQRSYSRTLASPPQKLLYGREGRTWESLGGSAMQPPL